MKTLTLEREVSLACKEENEAMREFAAVSAEENVLAVRKSAARLRLMNARAEKRALMHDLMRK